MGDEHPCSRLDGSVDASLESCHELYLSRHAQVPPSLGVEPGHRMPENGSILGNVFPKPNDS